MRLRRARALSRCGHVFHSGCIQRWFRTSLQCPCCRRGAVEAVRPRKNASLATAFKHVLDRGAFPCTLSDHERVLGVLLCHEVTDALGISLTDRAFLLTLAVGAHSADHFVDMLRRLRLGAAAATTEEVSAAAGLGPGFRPRAP